VDSLALLDQMRGPRPGGPRARRKWRPVSLAGAGT